MEIRFEKPAEKWGEALPAGNGHTGAMVYSGIVEDRIDLSENTFFSGKMCRENNRKDACKAFYQMRAKLMKNDFDGARHASARFTGNRQNYGTNLPVGSFYVRYGHDSSKAANYSRSLNILDGVIESAYCCDNTNFSRTVFVSHPHKVLVYKVCADRPAGLDITAGFRGTGDNFLIRSSGKGLEFSTRALEKMHSNGKTGVTLCGNAVVVTDGQVEVSDVVHVYNASEVVFYIGMLTDFKTKDKPEKIFEMLRMNAGITILDGWDNIKARHIEDINRYMKRADLRIQGKERHGFPVQDDGRAAKAIGCIPLLFQYGRYLLLSSSREDSRLPAHLQGIWNDNVACRIGWTCDMHLDINTQMNYWPSEVANLPETTESLFRWIKEDLVLSGRITAKESYGLPGWSADIVSNAWGFSAPYWASPISPCPTGGLWILTHMWEHFLFTRDEAFLKDAAYDIIGEAAMFFLGYIFQDPITGMLTAGPSISPENSFLVNGKKYQISNGCTYEVLMIRELFSIFLEASQILGVKTDLVRKAGQAVKKLQPYRIQSDGTIAEWSHDYPSSDLQHRHTSHLLGLFPFSQITPEETPELASAANESINKKLTPSESWEDTGWARSLLILYSARLHDGDAAYKHIDSMLEHLLMQNFMILHPPTRGAGAFDNVYELDGNTGLTAGIAEMLMQSHNGVIRLLPALPMEWDSGQVTGLVARGGVEVDIYWKEGKLVRAEFLSRNNQKCTVIYGKEIKALNLKGGEKKWI